MTRAATAVKQARPLWETVTEAFATEHTYGDAVPHKWFYQHFGLERPGSNMNYEEGQKIQLKHLMLMNQLRELLLVRHSMMLLPRSGFGYEVVKPSRQTVYAEAEALDKVNKALSKGRMKLTFVAKDQLTPEEQTENYDALCRLSLLEHMHTRVKKDRRVSYKT